MLRKSSINKSSWFFDVKVLPKLVVEIDEQHEELCLGGSFSRNDENRLRFKSLNNLEVVTNPHNIVPTVPICTACEYHSGSY